ncbi:MAG: lamin tail domain-containing protein [Candidatus Omnitrophica bacterium]|nr:lamin tail domain-containing protein [Candidatus Omnitrophota bacterium]
MLKVKFFLGVALLFLVGMPSTASAVILIHEILADPPTGILGDANRDGIASSANDEFVELFNSSLGAVDISGWSINDAVRERHVFFGGTLIQPQSLLVVFGGGVPDLPGIPWQVASTGTLSLNNSNETVTLLGLHDELIDQVFFGSEGGNDQSLVRSPEAGKNLFIKHMLLDNAQDRRYSPGEFINPPIVAAAQPPATAAVPEPATIGYLTIGFISYYAVRRREKGVV